jgi:formiminotetrahydrofolate cyclodeaminase
VLTGLSLPALLEELASPSEAPGAGSALAASLALAAAVVQMAARLSPDTWPDAVGVAAQAEALRERAVQLVDDDAEAYRQALEARDAADDAAKPEQRDWALGRVTSAAAEPPLALARFATDLAVLCAASGTRVEPRVHADVAAAGALAAAVARGARELVAVNLTALPGDARVEEADRLVAAAETAARSL